MEEYKSVAKYFQKKGQSSYGSKLLKETKVKHFFISFISRLSITTVLFLIVLIGCKNLKFKGFINEYVYHTNFQFASIKEWYQKNLGNIIPIKGNIPATTTPVFNEKLFYRSSNIYKDGVSLKVGNDYLVPILESGIIVYMGEKEGYGNTVIIQQVNGIDLWYSNIKFGDFKLYDYVEKGNLLGESIGEDIYLVFQKEGKFLNYKDYLE